MRLDQLPVEILANICSYADVESIRSHLGGNHGHPNLCALALTCRRISRVANDSLYSYIRVDLTAPVTMDMQRVPLLNRSFREDPTLVDSVHHLHFDATQNQPANYMSILGELICHVSTSRSLTKLSCHCIDHAWMKPCTTEDSLLAIYGRFPNLRRLTIETIRMDLGWGLGNGGGGNSGGNQDDDDDDLLNDPELDDPNDDDGHIIVCILFRLCELPSMERIDINASVIRYIEPRRPSRIPKFPNLKCMNFYPGRPVDVDTLELLLLRTPNLVALHLSMPGYNEWAFAQGVGLFQKLCGSLKPSFYAHILAPVANHLRRLSLGGDCVRFDEHDKTTINLSNFTNLSHLFIGGYFLFGPASRVSSNPDVMDT
ncbi:uncharacterized protein F4822DRAFT_430107 [Hypoxylon trugodes]|uniref:uncharacterized protein n=1 Tax=Hypoxylon trugodes TaxID=326681 RepID=UPI00219FE297|nr:uncharacterized protein F4822DRAFT_430107 [Hypoxylon trugodes]KAI1387355.1 hypothetical protein F4822DRAFT_430107 [Hypoxylon trugodes]